jgi:hypothetical protein
MWRSLLLPGWGQAILGRRVTGAAFIFWEGVTVTMTVKSLHQLAYQEDIDAETVDDKRQEVQDWAILWGFNHLLAGAEAYVAAILWETPADSAPDAVSAAPRRTPLARRTSPSSRWPGAHR